MCLDVYAEVWQQCPQEPDKAGHNDYASYYAVYQADGAHLELRPHLIYNICQPKPPQQRTCKDGYVAQSLLPIVLWHHKFKSCHQRYEQQYDEGVGEGDQKSGDAIVPQRTLVGIRGAQVVCGVAQVGVDAEEHEQYSAHHLEPEHVARILYDLHHETHAQERYGGIYDVGHGSTQSGDHAIPAPLVQRALYGQDANRPHGSAGQYAHNQALNDQFQCIDRFYPHNMSAKNGLFFHFNILL